MRVRCVYVVIAGALAMFSIELVRQYRESQYVKAFEVGPNEVGRLEMEIGKCSPS